jgi:TolB-like protein/Tfp pilus assembly protein PilF
MMYAIVNEEPISLSHYLKDVPDLLQSVIDKLLKKDPAERYQYITEILLDLEPLIKDSKILIVKQKSFFVKLFKMNKTYGIAAILVIAIILSLIIKFNFFTKQKLETSIAVLPLKNITQDTEQEWFSDGMTDALITELAQIRSLRVISRSSVMQFKEKNIPPPDIATKLGVQYLVDGSVTKTGDQVKISARLINAMDDEYIWAKEYDSIYKNILGIQSEIARSIANKIQVELTPSEKSRLSVTREVNPDTYEKYLKGMFFINKRTPEGVMKGIDYLNRAVETDPDEPLTHAGLSLGYSIIVHSPSPLEGSQERCKDEAMKALELDSTLAEAHLALAMIRIYGERNIAGAGESYRKALELNPNIPLAYMHYAWYMILTGKYEEAESCMENAMQLDPLSPVYPADYAWVLFWNGHFDESVMSAQKSLELAPDFPYANFVLSQSYSEKEMHEAAIEAAKKATQFNTDFKWGLAYSHARAGQKEEALKIAVELESHLTMFNTWCLAVIYAALGDADKTFFWLEEAYHQHHPYIQWIKRWHGFNPYKQDPRYISLVDLMDLPE